MATILARKYDYVDPNDRGVRTVGPVYMDNANLGAAATDMRVPIPFKGRFVGATAVLSAANSNKTGHIDFERGAASGTLLGTLSLTANASVGQVDTCTMVDGIANKSLWIEDSYINLEMTGQASYSSGAWNVYLFFETGPIAAADL